MSNSQDYLGGWITGFVDGEGCFFISFTKRGGRYKCKDGTVKQCYQREQRFGIGLRDDDAKTLKIIKKFWNCGRLYYFNKGRTRAVYYYVNKLEDLITIVIPHFERYPLKSKKKKDFEIWKRAVMLSYKKPRRLSPKQKMKFENLCKQLKQNRKYKGVR